MNRVQFMEQLKKLLSDISEEERQEALEYYESYFDDAGEDQEAEVIRELGSPGKVAAIIKEDLKGSSQNYGEFTENGFQDERVDNERQMPQNRADRGYHAERKGGKASVILVLILLVFISPLIKGAVGGVLGFIVALASVPDRIRNRGGCSWPVCCCSSSDRSRNWNLFYSTSVWCPSRWNWSAPVCIGTCWSCVPEMGSNLCTSGTSA